MKIPKFLTSKAFKLITKIILSILLLASALLLILLSLNNLSIINSEILDNLTNTSFGNWIKDMQINRGYKFSLVYYGVVILFSYMSFWIALSIIPFSKLPKMIINWFIGTPIISIAALLIIIGIILLNTNI